MKQQKKGSVVLMGSDQVFIGKGKQLSVWNDKRRYRATCKKHSDRLCIVQH
jgi:hypothetical protein